MGGKANGYGVLRPRVLGSMMKRKIVETRVARSGDRPQQGRKEMIGG